MFPNRRTHRLTCLAAALALLTGANIAHAQVDPATGTLTVGSVAPQNNKLKIEVGPSAGEVRVIDN